MSLSFRRPLPYGVNFETAPVSSFVAHINNKKKKFKEKPVKCNFCQKKGHEARFCPLTPTKDKGVGVCKWAAKPMPLSDVDVASYGAIGWEQATEALLALGGALLALGKTLNEGNPWASTFKPVATPMKKLGKWKAIGASKSVLS